MSWTMKRMNTRVITKSVDDLSAFGYWAQMMLVVEFAKNEKSYAIVSTIVTIICG